MLRNAADKVMWVGRATVFVVGLAVIIAAVAGLVSAALAGTGVGTTFDLGKLNTVNHISRLVGSTNDPLLRADNDSAGTNATALDLKVEPGHTPMRVNSSTKVANLNADMVDGKNSAAFADVNELGGQVVIRRSGPLPVEGTYTSQGGTLVIMASGSGERGGGIDVPSGPIGMHVKVDGSVRGIADGFAESPGVSEVLVGTNAVVEGLPHGTHTIRLEPVYDDDCNTVDEDTSTYCISTNSHDRFAVTVVELSD